MQDIKEIILILNQNNVFPFLYLEEDEETAAGSKLLALYKGFSEGVFHTDEDARLAIYGPEKPEATYRKLKSDLREKLFESVININTEQSVFSDYQKAYYQCHRHWVIVRILTGMNANTSAMSLATKLLKQADKFNFTLLCMDITSYLRIQYGLRESNDKKFLEADQQFRDYRELYDSECLAEQLYTHLIVKHVNNRSAHEEVHQLSGAYMERLKPLLASQKSYKLQMYGYLVGLLHYTSMNDYEGALEYSKMAIDFYEQRPYEARVPLQIFYYQNLICNIQLRRFDAGEQAARQCLKFMKEGMFNWFKYQELFLHLSLHTGEFKRASDTLYQILNHPRFPFLPDNVKELWGIYEAYIHYLYLFGKVNHPLAGKFKLSRFISNTFIFQKDKGGVNVAIIIIRLLILLKERKLDILLDEYDAINQYCYRHLRGENTKRSFAMIKMLLTAPMAQYDADEIEKKVVKLKSRLKESPFQLDNQTHEIEIIPYELLWQMAMDDLRQRKGKK